MARDFVKASESSCVIIAEDAITLQFVEFLTSANEALRDERAEMCKNFSSYVESKNLFTLK